MNPSVTSIYDAFIWSDTKNELAERLYANPPKTLGISIDRIGELVKKYQDMNWYDEGPIKSLKRDLMRVNKGISCLTPDVKRNINRLENGGIEAAHQAVVMGGPCYILNKAATASSVAEFARSSDHDIAPFFFLAEYDEVQTELTNTRTPLMGQEGNLVSIPVPDGYEYSPISAIPLPKNSDWFDQIEESIKSNYHPIFKILEGHARNLLEERLEHAMSIIRWAYVNSATLSEWALHILGRLFNIEGSLGIPLVPSSSPVLRDLMTKGMEFLLSRVNRATFLKVHAECTALIDNNGYSSGMGERPPDYVPFYYECPGDECHQSRTELHYEDKGSKTLLNGSCPTCDEHVEIEVSAIEPDLKEFSALLSPRVDSRQMILDMVFPVLGHVGGSGETAYYAQVIPIAQALSIPFPMFLKYPRTYFNTPWNEQLAKELGQKQMTVFHKPEMFKLMGKVNRFRKKEQSDQMNSALAEFERFLIDTHTQMNLDLAQLKEKLNTPEGKKDMELAVTRLDMERYLSWAFGQYTEGKLGQESTWSWIEWVLNSGVPDLFGPYQRAYVPEMNNGSTLFINFSF